ncbi:MAG: ABC transporter ATP-binding protein [Sandaracinaceae bacterium]|nr:ABC transporter ATP-binding protein [Sandaracinaceae bacterium]
MTTETKGDSVLVVKNLSKVFYLGLFRKRVEAVRGVSFEVKRGETFGLLGPNGAGKTTTLKMVLGLVFPSGGSIRIFDFEGPTPQAMKQIGYLPESPYLYQYLKPLEFLDLCGRLYGLSAAERKKRGEEVLAKVGLLAAVDRPIGRFSKGMMQRMGLAQALLHDPAFLIFDEPMSGLDPIGRKMVRDIILEERKRGKTILLTSHILSDVELLCDRVAIVHRGRVSAYGALSELLRPEVRQIDIEIELPSPASFRGLEELLAQLKGNVNRSLLGQSHGRFMCSVPGHAAAQKLIQWVFEQGGQLIELHEKRETLEDLFMRGALSATD